MKPNKNPKEATHWDPAYGPVTTWVHGKGKQPNTLIIGTKAGSELRVVSASTVKFKFSENKKIRVRDLKALISEALGDDAGGEGFKEVTDDSLDNQVDRYLGQYEGEAKTVKAESRTLRDITRRFLNEVEDSTDGDEEGDEPAAEEPEADAAPAKLTAEDLDVEAFVVSVVRLIENYDSLLEFRDTILRRAKNFLGKSYDPDVVAMFEDILREDHGIVDGKSDDDVAADEFVPPTGERGGLDPNAAPGGA